MPARRLINRIGPFLAMVIFVGISVGVLEGTRRFSNDAAWVSHTHEVIARVDEIEARLRDAEAAQRGYLLTRRVEYLADYRAGRAQLPDLFERLQELVADNTPQEQRVAALRGLVDQRVEQMEHVLSIFEDRGRDAAVAAIGGQIHATSEAIRRQTRSMTNTERKLLVERAAYRDRSALMLKGLAIAGIPFGIGIVAMVYWLMRREIRARDRADLGTRTANERLSASVQALEHRTSELRQLSLSAGMLQSCINAEEAMRLTAQLLSQLLPNTDGTIYRIRASEDYAEAVMHWGEHAKANASMLTLDACWALRRGQPHLVGTTETASRCAHVHAAPDQPLATACIPLAAQGVQLGFVHVTGTDDAFLERLHILEAASEQLAMSLINLRLQERLRLQSIREPLTGLFNRRYLEESLSRELARCARRGFPLTLMMLDLDHFKRFNDTHGHPGGDALLAAFGQLLAKMSRPEDIACRYGGEEFTLILPEVPEPIAVERANAIRAAVQAMQVQHLGKELPPVTVSIGIAVYPQCGAEPELLLRRADEALYRAKSAGRNQAAMAAPDPALLVPDSR
ncbi:sensor domain-containing diguanylate cyclase [Pseudoxanthomonas composti]|uniref:diguanylate cyclase n=1 Tax=Pseudoxanthomonas composti TaxID=2137479 RepID=A0A4V1N0W7_9GAMM|nr:GGDEF domain-containing protein [Pseudoxanthomonas composti]RXR03489.1 GGDEF domain-containing protein [Pseudoxanthomonas composti]